MLNKAEYLKNTMIVYKLDLANYLIQNGQAVKYIRPNTKNRSKLIFYFEKGEEVSRLIKEYANRK